MATLSRIKFNPETKEIEIEGSEKFVKTYFDKVQQLISGAEGEAAPRKRRRVAAAVAKPAAGRKAQKVASKAAPKKGKVGRGAGKRNISKTILSLIGESKEGMTTTQLKDETGFGEKQIWAVIYRAEKMGKIRKAKRGLYIAV